jgi:hypothetical protein
MMVNIKNCIKTIIATYIERIAKSKRFRN